jgi:23S rRNA U2552 (ribose-2'-O)-methylase RlmE/FtsJ
MEVLLPNINKKIIPKLKKTKGSYGLKIFSSDEVLEKEKEARALKPFSNIKYPYWYFLLLSEPYFFALAQYQKMHTHKFAEELYKPIFKNIDSIFPVSFFSNFSISEYYIFKKFIKNKNNKNLFITNKIFYNIIEEYLFYNEYNNENSYKVINNLLYLKNFHYKGDIFAAHTDEEKLEFKDYFSKKKDVNYYEYPDNVCDYNNLNNYINTNIKDKLDNIFINVGIYLWINKNNTSYINCQNLFNLILVSINKLKKDGLLLIKIESIDNQLIIDIIALLQYYFKKVYIIKPETVRIISDYKYLVCDKFIGIEDIDYYNNLILISKKWHEYEKSCSIDIRKGPEEDKLYITSFFNYKDNINLIKDFIKEEDISKIDMFNIMINNYNSLKNEFDNSIFDSYQDSENKIIYKKLQKSIELLKNYNIPLKVSLREINNKIFEIKLHELFYKRKFIINNNINNNLLKIEDLFHYENNLKIHKRRLDYFDEKKYHDISKIFTKTFGNLKDKISEKIKFKISQGFIKMYEILYIFSLLSGDNIKTFHCCEAPGQFILACETYLKKYNLYYKNNKNINNNINNNKNNNKNINNNKNNINNNNINWMWNAQSLNPSIKTALKDDYGLIKKYKDRWDFGADDTGDITKIENIKYYKKYLKECNLITFDCGIFFKTNFEETYQDKFMGKINYASILMILNGLKIGSNYVIKVFLPQSLKSIISLNYILFKHTEDFYMFKTKQNSSSSEVYIIGKNFLGIENDLLDKLFEFYKKEEFDEFIIDVDEYFINMYVKNLQFFIQKNIDGLVNTIYYIENIKDNNITEFKKDQKININKWFLYFKL